MFLLVTLIGGAGGYLLVPRPGTLELSVQPPNALMALDGVPVAGGPILQLSRRAGVYRLTVSAPGYLPFDRSIQISARQFGHLKISLRPSPDTGFELTSSPSGAPVWLDGQPLSVSSDGKQALTNLHATGIAPGLHAIEIRESSKFQPWGEEFMQEPGRTVRLHANLLPLPRSEKVASLRSLVGNDERPTGRERQKSSGGSTRSRQAPRESVPSSLEDAEDPFETMGGVP